jgi:hypothetical protein
LSRNPLQREPVEQVLLRREEVEDRTAGETGLLLESGGGHTPVPVHGEPVACTGQGLLPAFSSSLVTDARHALIS